MTAVTQAATRTACKPAQHLAQACTCARGCASRTLIKDTHQGHSSGTLIKDTHQGHSSGTLIKDTHQGRSSRTLTKDAHQGHSSGTIIRDTHQGHGVFVVILTAWAARSLSSSSGATKYGAPLFERLSHLSACALEMSSFRT